MPSAIASFDDAFDMEAPRKKTPRKPRAVDKGPARKRGGRKLPRFAFDGPRTVRLAAIGMSGTLVVAIMVNALLLQKGHHPAPLFGQSIALGPSPVAVPKAPPAPRAAPVATPQAEEAPEPAAPASRNRAASAERAPDGDAIAALIAGHAPSPSTAPKTEGKTVLGAQKALAKLGFALKPSGTMGPQTRKAIEAFERDRHMPVKGELTHRLVKILAAESGVRID